MNIFPIIIFVYNLKHIFPQCVLRFKDDSIKQTLVRRLNSIYNQKYSTLAGSNMGDVKYQYKICDCPSEEIKHLNSSVIQYQLTDNKWGSNKLIGSHLEMDIDGGDNWFLITYYEGDPYLDMCLGSKRKAKIIILCDTTVKKPTFKFLYEFKNMINISPIQNKEAKIPDCGYVFELRLWEDSFCVDDKNPSHSNPGKRRHQGKSTGSILSILFFTFFGVYLTFGTLYRKFILGVGNGIDILPNLDFWRNFLELQADGCNYFFRENPIVKSRTSSGSRNDYSSFSNQNINPIPSYNTPNTGLSLTSDNNSHYNEFNNLPGATSNAPLGYAISSHDENLLR